MRLRSRTNCVFTDVTSVTTELRERFSDVQFFIKQKDEAPNTWFICTWNNRITMHVSCVAKENDKIPVWIIN